MSIHMGKGNPLLIFLYFTFNNRGIYEKENHNFQIDN